MANLMKCDNCGNRYTMCFLCNKNEYYRETKYSYKRSIRNEAIDGFVKHLENEISENTIWGMLPIGSRDSIADEIVEYVIDISKKIAEQMKEGE